MSREFMDSDENEVSVKKNIVSDESDSDGVNMADDDMFDHDMQNKLN